MHGNNKGTDILQWYILRYWCDKSRKDQGDVHTKITSNCDQNITHPGYPMHIMLSRFPWKLKIVGVTVTAAA